MNTRREIVIAFGVAALTPPLALSQPHSAKAPRIGFLGNLSAARIEPLIQAFREGLRDLHYVEGKNINIDYRWAEADYSRLGKLAVELVQLDVDVIVTSGTPGTRAAMAATKTVPIVMTSSGDPVANRLVSSFARPGGNVTGLSFFQPEVLAKRLELIKEGMPQVTKVAYLMNSRNSAASGPTLRAMQSAAKLLKIDLLPVAFQRGGDLPGAFATIAKSGIQAIVTNEDSVINAHQRDIAESALKLRLPAIGSIAAVEAGYLFGYGIDLRYLFRRSAYYIDRILKGAKPADLPVEQPTRFELYVNMNTARALGLTMPPEIMVQATRVIQ